MIMMASDSHSQNDEFTVKRSSSVECDSECNDHDQKMDDQNSQQIKKKLNFSVDRLLNSNSRPLVDYSDVKLCAKFENGISLWRPTPIRAMINASICGSDQYHPSYSVLTQAMMLKYQQQQQHHQQHHHHHHHQQSSTNNNNNSSSSNSGPPLSGPPNHQNFRSNNFILAKSLVDVDGGGSGCGSIQNLVPSNGKRKKSWSRAVFSNLQRKGLEIQFQQQKYITKPDRRKLAMRLNLSDSQVKVWFQNRRMKWRHTQENLKSGHEKSVGGKLTTTTSVVTTTTALTANSIPTLPHDVYGDEPHSYTASSDDQSEDEIDVVE